MSIAQQKMILDRTNFPMVRIEQFDCYVNFLPITKIQFEYFLCDRVASRGFDEAWYHQRLQQNPRCAPSQVNSDNFHNAFLTSIKPNVETQLFGEWLVGPDYVAKLPELAEWNAIYDALKAESEINFSEVQNLEGINRRAVELIRNLRSLNRASIVANSPFAGGAQSSNNSVRKLTHQLLYQGGILEWVSDGNEWGGRGGADRKRGGGGANIDPVSEGLRQLNTHDNDPPPESIGFRFIVQAR